VGAVDGLAAQACAAQHAVLVVLLGLLVRIVAGLAQALQVVAVEEQAQIPAVWPDVVHHASRYRLPQLQVHAAQRMQRQLRPARFEPGSSAVEVVVFGAHRVHKEKPRQTFQCGGAMALRQGEDQYQGGETNPPDGQTTERA
jgi:hypothetical protein